MQACYTSANSLPRRISYPYCRPFLGMINEISEMIRTLIFKLFLLRMNWTWKNCFKQSGLRKKVCSYRSHNFPTVLYSIQNRALKKWIDVNLACENEELIWWLPDFRFYTCTTAGIMKLCYITLQPLFILRTSRVSW